MSEELLKRINEAGRVHMIPAKLRQIFVIRMAICSRFTETSDVDNSWNEIRQQTDVFLSEKTASE